MKRGIELGAEEAAEEMSRKEKREKINGDGSIFVGW